MEITTSEEKSNENNKTHSWRFEVEHTDNSPELYVRVLMEFCKGAKIICEIGSGVSTDIFKNEVEKRDGHVWSFDIRSRPYISDHCTFMDTDSLYAVWTKKMDLLYIDGDHRGEQVRKELISYAPFVQPGGIILLDDVRHPGVPTKFLPDNLEKVVDEFCWLNGVTWKYCAGAPNKIACIFIHKWLGHGK